MAALRYLMLLGVLACAPAMAQVRGAHHSAGEPCSAPAAAPPTTDPATPGAQAKPVPAAPPSSGATGCTHCGDPHYRMPPRWHSFLPGMYR